MARHKDSSYEQGKLIPAHVKDQILPGTFEYTIHCLIDNELDRSTFEGRCPNEETGPPAYDPTTLLKIVLLAYSRGVTTSRKIAHCRCHNILIHSPEYRQPIALHYDCRLCQHNGAFAEPLV